MANNTCLCRCDLGCPEAFTAPCSKSGKPACYKCPHAIGVTELDKDTQKQYKKLKELSKQALISIILFNKMEV